MRWEDAADSPRLAATRSYRNVIANPALYGGFKPKQRYLRARTAALGADDSSMAVGYFQQTTCLKSRPASPNPFFFLFSA